MYQIQINKQACFHVSEYWIGYKMNGIYYRNTTEPTSVPHYCVSVERGLDVYEKLVTNTMWTSRTDAKSWNTSVYSKDENLTNHLS